DFRMHYRNADGGEADMCGNGGRVLAAFATTRGLGRKDAPGATLVRFLSRWGEHEARVRATATDLYDVTLTLPDVPAPEAIDLDAPWGPIQALLVRAGVPHLVVDRAQTPAATLERIEIVPWGHALRSHTRLGVPGANVDFVERAPDGVLAVRTYERGVEGETLACGTGATATASAAVHWAWGRSPVRLRTKGGDLLTVTFENAGGALREVTLEGPAQRVFATEYESPTPTRKPSWAKGSLDPK
ncbi:MAG TPA: diaminopimelate epimerase, partial [Candidatus Eisenbacteria bacterium]|nr:diaminopimelate epimerase [Candidatus Eisenbacteria bacterium]